MIGKLGQLNKIINLSNQNADLNRYINVSCLYSEGWSRIPRLLINTALLAIDVCNTFPKPSYFLKYHFPDISEDSNHFVVLANHRWLEAHE